MSYSYTEALKDVHNGLNHVMRGRSISVLNYPGLDEVIEESNPHIIEVSSTARHSFLVLMDLIVNVEGLRCMYICI